MTFRDQVRKGSTETLVLLLLGQEAMYGYQICQEMTRRSGGYFEMKEGLLYPTLHRMQQDGLLASEWREAENGRRRKYYLITAEGRAVLGEQTAEWHNFMTQLQALLGGSQPQEGHV